MKRLVIAAFAAVVGLGMMAPEAEAKRLGGGSSINAEIYTRGCPFFRSG